MEFVDEASATVAKDALHNYKLDGENKIKVCPPFSLHLRPLLITRCLSVDHLREEVRIVCTSDAPLTHLTAHAPLYYTSLLYVYGH